MVVERPARGLGDVPQVLVTGLVFLGLPAASLVMAAAGVAAKIRGRAGEGSGREGLPPARLQLAL